MNNPAIQYLLSDGWKEYPDQFREYARCFGKRFDTPTPCACNSDKEGMQICIAVSKREDFPNYEIELHGELPDGTWIKLHNHGMPDDIEKGLAIIPRLLATWEFLCGNESTEPRPEEMPTSSNETGASAPVPCSAVILRAEPGQQSDVSVVVSGIDGSGKTSVQAVIANALRAAGMTVQCRSFEGDREEWSPRRLEQILLGVSQEVSRRCPPILVKLDAVNKREWVNIPNEPGKRKVYWATIPAGSDGRPVPLRVSSQ